MRWRARSARCLRFSLCTGVSPNQYSPSQPSSSSASTFSSDDFPAPDGPITVTNSPSLMVSRSAQHPGFGVAGLVTAFYVLQFDHDVLLRSQSKDGVNSAARRAGSQAATSEPAASTMSTAVKVKRRAPGRQNVAAGKLDGKPGEDAANRQSDAHQQQRPAQNQREDVALRRAKRNAQADLARALRDGKREQAVEADRSDQQARPAKLPAGARSGLAAKGIFDRFVNGLYVGGGGVGSDFVQRLVELRAQRSAGTAPRMATWMKASRCRRAVFPARLRQAEVHLRLGGFGDLAPALRRR
jgi:hypothetical protein